LCELLASEDEKYRSEAVANEPTIDDRIAEKRRSLKELRDKKEKERQAIAAAKYLQQALLVFTAIYSRIEMF
jgi:hypothetical protein